MTMLLRRMKVENVTVHRIRSAFRHWCADETAFPREVAEAAPAQTVGNAAEQAYRRSSALDKRRKGGFRPLAGDTRQIPGGLRHSPGTSRER